MKINTDGVLIGALAAYQNPVSILDIGTGTGVIALMLAQRFLEANVDAIEIDEKASNTAFCNFLTSPFKDRLKLHSTSFEKYFSNNVDQKFDLIVSNPPFYINSFKCNSAIKTLAKHTDGLFFETLIALSSVHLTGQGNLILILPPETGELVTKMSSSYGLTLKKKIVIKSFYNSIPHREVLTFGYLPEPVILETFLIYETQKEYSKGYKHLLKDFLTIF